MVDLAAPDSTPEGYRFEIVRQHSRSAKARGVYALPDMLEEQEVVICCRPLYLVSLLVPSAVEKHSSFVASLLAVGKALSPKLQKATHIFLQTDMPGKGGLAFGQCDAVKGETPTYPSTGQN